MFRRIVVALLAAGLVAGAGAGLGGCARLQISGRPVVVASFYPLQFVAQRIVGPYADVVTLTRPGVEPHDLELTVRQAAILSAAEVGFYEKGLQPSVDQAMAVNGPRHIVDVTSSVVLHSPEAGYAEETAGGLDPHFWLDPTLLAKAAAGFTRTMVAADPRHAATYRANDERLAAALHRLDVAFRTGLAHCTLRTIVVSHDAWEYVARRYHLQVEPIAGLSPDAEPSARHLAEIGQLIRRDHITTVFAERLGSQKLSDTLAHDLGVRTGVLDPIEGLLAGSNENYLSIQRANLAAIRRANSCS